jgi:hypothetical protein
MISSKDLLEKTGIKSIRTLTRWHKRGIIPKPLIHTHPSGRGKMAYWPDWVLDKCKKIVELRKKGHTLNSSVIKIQLEQVEKTIEEVSVTPSVSDILENKKVNLKNGREIALLDLFLFIILGEIKRLTTDHSLLSKLMNRMKEQKVVDKALDFLRAGYNAVLFFDGIDFLIIPDFLVSHYLQYGETEARSCLVVPLLPPLRKAFQNLGKELPGEPNAHPAPKIWARQGDALVEYLFSRLGPLGFELIRETAITIGEAPTESEKDNGACESKQS